MKLVSEYLELTAATLPLVCAELDSPGALEKLLQVPREPDWPPGEYDRSAQEYFRERLQAGGAEIIGWLGWYAVRMEADRASALVGAAGFFGPPDQSGLVEIGFSVLPAWRGRGYALEMVRVLVNFAFRDRRVDKVIAYTAVENAVSARVLLKCGFVRSGRDSDSGLDCYELARPASTAPDTVL